MNAAVLSSRTGNRTARPRPARRWQQWLSVSLGVWSWCAACLIAVAAVPLVAMQAVAADGAGFVINGSKAEDLSGVSVSDAGDVNGDGLADVVVGANRADPNGQNYAGRSYVVFGKRDKLPVELAAIESGTSPAGFVINGSNTSDFSGRSVSRAGDVNGDGLSDLIVNAGLADPNGLSSAGRSYVVFGKTDTTPVELAAIESGTSPAGFVINGSNAYDVSGGSVSGAGDVNGDGLADLIVGAGAADPNGRSKAGRSYVVFGKRDKLPVELAAIESGTSPAGFVMNGSNAYDYSGFSVSEAGDVNGDGLDDLIVGAYRADSNGLSSAGRSYVVFGKTDTTPVELAAIESGTSPAGFVINGSNAVDYSGRSVSGAGDVNGDGLDDLIVGARFVFPQRPEAGRSYVVFGRTDTTPVELAAIESGTSQAGFVINGSKVYDYSGFSVSGAGDVNGDGLADLIVGAYGADPKRLSSAGRSYVLFGKTNTTPVELAAIERGTRQAAGFVINGSNADDDSGFSVSGAGDVNGDGLADLIVGATGADPNGQSRAGRSYVVFGKTDTTPVKLAAIERGTR